MPDKINTILQIINNSMVEIAVGLSGGLVAVWLSNAKGKLTLFRFFGIIFLGLCGAVFIAPAINDYFGFNDRIASAVSFLTAVFTEIILLTLLKVFTYVHDHAPEIIKKYVTKSRS